MHVILHGIGMPEKKPVTWNNKQYKSIQQLADEKGVSHSTIIYWLKMGYTKNSDINSYRDSVFTFEGKTYSSIKQLAQMNYISLSHVYRMIKQGIIKTDE